MAREIWVIRAGKSIADRIEQSKLVAIGWYQMGDLSKLNTREDFKAKYREVYAENDNRVGIGAGQLFRFSKEISIGDTVLTPLSASREILIGKITSDYKYDKIAISESYPNVRSVEWLKKISRDIVSQQMRNSLGGLQSLFTITDHGKEVEKLLGAEPAKAKPVPEEPQTPYHEEVQAKADEMISDLLSQIAPYEFQNLVAALLRAMGFYTKISQPGPDGGIDIKAFPDALGFQTPRIRVQVKHRKGSATAPEVQQLAGATKGENFNGLFVSTGGFTNQAITEGDKHPHITLIDRDDFVSLLLGQYEKLEPEYQALVPLAKVYIPSPPAK
jgi:restriction system protein